MSDKVIMKPDANRGLDDRLYTVKYEVDEENSHLAVVDPQMHSQEEVQAILGLFEGEIRVSEKETAKGTEKILKIKKLYNQRYLENELSLTKQKLA